MSGMGCMSRYLVAIGLVGLTLGAAAPALAQSPPPPVVAVEAEAQQPVITDETITASITARLEQLILLRNAQLTVSTKARVVTLVGMVPTDFAHQQALEVARRTPGVLVIDDQMRVPVWSPTATTRN